MEIYLIRHAESTYNRWAFKRIYNPCLWFNNDPMIYDAPLSDNGSSQALELHSSISELSKKVDLIICSPLTRAIDTMKIAFPNISCPVIITPLVRERGDKTCDIGKPLSVLREKYPNYNFIHFNNEYWWTCNQNSPFELVKETSEHLKKRQLDFIKFLNTTSEKVVVIFTHGKFIKSLLKKKMQIKNCGVQKSSLAKLKNKQNFLPDL